MIAGPDLLPKRRSAFGQFSRGGWSHPNTARMGRPLRAKTRPLLNPERARAIIGLGGAMTTHGPSD
jgi:hypothetical protein